MKPMPKTIPISRNTSAARARRVKAMLLPMPRATADELALRVHLALALMRAGSGSMTDAQTLTQTMILTGFLAEAGYGAARHEQLIAAEAAIAGSFDHGRETGRWELDDHGTHLFTAIVTTYDEQLRRAPLWAVAEASERLDRFQSGGSDQRAERKLA